MTNLESHFQSLAAQTKSFAEEAQYYWQRHEVRYRHMAKTLAAHCPNRKGLRVLDVGMGFETLLLRRLYPEAVVDCLGVYCDERFQPGGEHSFFSVDLNTLVDEGAYPALPETTYDVIVFMEVLEHLITPPRSVLKYLSRLLAPGGVLLVTTPNAAWLKNRIKLLRGVNPFEQLRATRSDFGHIREYTRDELIVEIAQSDLRIVEFARKGLYAFSGTKDRLYSWLADLIHPSLSRTLAVVCRRKASEG